jgi:hypothetical protein
MNTSEITNIVLNYFSGFAERNIDTISKNFADNITLQDWEGRWENYSGVKEAILSAINHTDSLVIIPKDIQVSIYGPTSVATCRIDIIINGKTTLKVVDIITLYNDFGGLVITNIDAYKQ